MGLRLVAGRWFQPDEIGEYHYGVKTMPTAIIVTAALAKQLYPDGTALGSEVYQQDQNATIVGIVERLQTPWPSMGFGEPFVETPRCCRCSC